VIFTTRETEASTEPDGLFRDEKGNEAYVVYIPGLGGPSEKSTAVWLEKMTTRDANYFGDDPHIILDSLNSLIDVIRYAILSAPTTRSKMRRSSSRSTSVAFSKATPTTSSVLKLVKDTVRRDIAISSCRATGLRF